MQKETGQTVFYCMMQNEKGRAGVATIHKPSVTMANRPYIPNAINLSVSNAFFMSPICVNLHFRTITGY